MHPVRFIEGLLGISQERGKNNLGKSIVAITFRMMISKEDYEVALPEFLSMRKLSRLSQVSSDGSSWSELEPRQMVAKGS